MRALILILLVSGAMTAGVIETVRPMIVASFNKVAAVFPAE